ncbi:MAG: ABC transporter ATP-binding protein [Nanoarchaeota archaeon]|nr:ABC transporter ATP-binding protein [Nanoarchaeota archaeon]
MLEVRNLNLCKEYPILKDINFSVEENQVYGILGPNGAGKSSLAYALMGIEEYKPDSGTVIYQGKDIMGLSISERAKMGISMLWQEPVRFEGISVKDYLQLGCKDKGVNIEEYLFKVGLNGDYLDRMVDETLSGGERKRIELASILTLKPKLAILDEPDSGIDMVSLDYIADIINELKSYGSSIILVTHNEEVTKLSDKSLLICDGFIVKKGEPEEIITYFKEKCNHCPTKRDKNG